MQQKDTLTPDVVPEENNATVRSDVSVASSGYVQVSAPAKSRKCIPPYTPEEPPPDYDVSPNHTLMVRETSVPLLKDEPDAGPSGEMRVNISGASPTQRISIQISPQSANDSDVFLFTDKEKDKRNKKSHSKRCTKREKCLTTVVLVLLVLLLGLALLIVNFTVCVGGFTSKCDD